MKKVFEFWLNENINLINELKNENKFFYKIKICIMTFFAPIWHWIVFIFKI